MTQEALRLALKRAFQFGQDYWYQADHDSPRQNKKSDETLAQFRQLVDQTCEALAEQPAQRTWVGLTRAERLEIEKDMKKYYDYQHECKTVSLPEFSKAIEAKLKEKNT